MEAEDTKLGLLCFLNDTRECNAACMAFITHPAGAGPELVDAQAHCLLLQSIERIGRHTTIIASLLSAGEKRQRTSAADKQREDSLPKNPFPVTTHPGFPKSQP
jgi:hypothetical protein